MTSIQILTILMPILGGLCIGALVFVTTHLDDKAAEAELKARLSSSNDNAARMASAAE